MTKDEAIKLLTDNGFVEGIVFEDGNIFTPENQIYANDYQIATKNKIAKFVFTANDGLTLPVANTTDTENTETTKTVKGK